MDARYTWSGATLNEVSCQGTNYLYSLLCDYERYIKNYGYISIEDFLPQWTCITYHSFQSLSIGESVYAPDGNEYIVMETPCESDDESYLLVEVTRIDDDGKFDDTGWSNETFTTGDLYNEPVTHRDYKWRKKINREREEKICPILITKTNQPQN